METVTSAVTSVLTMFTSVFNFVTSNPLLLAFVVVPLVGGIIYIITSLFRK